MQHNLCFKIYMEPPSSVNNDLTMAAGTKIEDPLANFFTPESYFVVTCCTDENREGSIILSGYSPATGSIYFGTTSSIKS